MDRQAWGQTGDFPCQLCQALCCTKAGVKNSINATVCKKMKSLVFCRVCLLFDPFACVCTFSLSLILCVPLPVLQSSIMSMSSIQSGGGDSSTSSVPPGEPSMRPGELGVEWRGRREGRGEGGERRGRRELEEGEWEEGRRGGEGGRQRKEGGGERRKKEGRGKKESWKEERGRKEVRKKGEGGRQEHTYTVAVTSHAHNSLSILYNEPSPDPLSPSTSLPPTHSCCKSKDCLHCSSRWPTVSKPRSGHPCPPTA